MRQRRRFIVRGNFQLAFLAGVGALAALCVVTAAIANGIVLAQVIDRAAFLAHPELRSSGELIGATLWRVTLLVAGPSLFIGALLMAWGLWAQERLFHELLAALKQLTQGEHSARLAPGRLWYGRSLVKSFNAAAEALDARAHQRRIMLEEAQMIVEAEDPQKALERLAALQDSLKQLEGNIS